MTEFCDPEWATETAEALQQGGVVAVAVTFVDNTGVTRTKAVPVGRLASVARAGIGVSPCFETFTLDDGMTRTKDLGGPDGDLRLVPDLDRIVPLAAMPGWAWAPGDKYEQDRTPWASCQRTFLRRIVDAAAVQGLRILASYELEWCVGSERDGAFEPAFTGPAYGMARLEAAADYGREVVQALLDEGVAVEQFHPEYAEGQLEVSVAPNDPVRAADTAVLVRETIRALSLRRGWRASFAPSVVPGAVGNGAHVHLSVWDGDRNLFAGGDRRHGLTERGESFLAGVLTAMPALVAVGAPSPASYLRLVPSHWAGAYRCWARENREAALRFVTGTAGTEASGANAELKFVDGSANPYLALGAILAAGLATVGNGLRLPEEVHGDPSHLSDKELAARGVQRLPRTLDESLDELRRSLVLRTSMGELLHDAFCAVRAAEADLFRDADPRAVTAATRWLY